jgi:trimethylamine--corrinoid protein Co-methyltransferase
MKRGVTGGVLKLFSDEQLQRVHMASLTLLNDLGVESESDLILDLFAGSGAHVDRDSRIVRLPPDMIEEALRLAPKSFNLYGRDPAMDCLMEPGRVYYGMGGTSEPYYWDHDLQRPRSPTKADMVDNTRIGQAAANIDFVMALCSAGDVPSGKNYLHEYDAILRNTTKPVVYTSPGQWHTRKFLEMAAAVSGGEHAFRERPCVVFFAQPVSPMRIGRYSEGMVQAAQMGVPMLFSPGPMMGATCPVTLAGMLAQTNAEALFGIVLSQVIRAGTPIFYSPHTAVMDMATAQCTYASPEQALGRVAVAQLGYYYGLPTFGLGGGVESKLPDAEAAAQAMMGCLLNALAGLTLTQTLGTLASGLYGCREMVLICDEIVHMIKRVLDAVDFGEDAMALDVIKEVGHGGEFLSHRHTARLFRTELFFPHLFKRQSVEQWTQAGGKTITEVAHERVLGILAKSGPVPLPDGADEAMTRVLNASLAEMAAGLDEYSA